MLRTLHTIGFLCLAVAGFLIALCVAGSLREDSDTGRAVTLSAVEQFMQMRNSAAGNGDDQVSPLVRQAQAFALYLNPPAAAAPATHKDQALALPGKDNSSVMRVTQVRPASSSPNFELHGISYYRAKPEESMALIGEPGGHQRWVRQGAQLGHLTVERIDGDSIVYREGTQTHVMALASKEALTKFAQANRTAPAPKQTGKPVRTLPAAPPVRGIRQMPLWRVAAKTGVPLSPLPQSSPMELQ